MTSTALTPDLLDLMEHEKVIEQGLGTFLDVGHALLAIRDGKKYRCAEYDTFEAYCKRRWDFSSSYARKLMSAAETVEVLESGTIVPLSPVRETQVRPLAALKTDNAKANAWSKAVEAADGAQPTARQVAKAVAEVSGKPLISKPDLGCGVSHPARFSDPLMPVFAGLLAPGTRVLDPFAGTGKVHELRDLAGVETVGVEIEPEWAAMHPDTLEGNALALPFDADSFGAVVTSPTYGNRLADHHNAADPELRRSYAHDLGHDLHTDNSGAMQWGDEYRTFHEAAWREAYRVIAPGGLLVLNIKDHIRGGVVQHVMSWHVKTLLGLGFDLERAAVAVPTVGLRQGENADARCVEQVLTFVKP